MMRVGIFFGGLSAEREVSLTSGRMVYRYLDRQLFTPVPIFVDSLGNFIILNQHALQQTAIRDFYPAPNLTQSSDFSVYIESLGQLSDDELQKHIAQIGEQLLPTDFSKIMDFAFIAMHGPYGEDGTLQGLLEWYGIPFSGSGVMSSAIGIDKISQNQLIEAVNNQNKKYTSIIRQDWKNNSKEEIFENLQEKVGLPMVLKAPHQGSSLGVKIVREADFQNFYTALNYCFSILEITKDDWTSLEKNQKIEYVNNLADVTKGIGFPIYFGENLNELIYHPENLYKKLDNYFEHSTEKAILTSVNGENEILVEEFVAGREFTCSIILDDNGKSIALIPAEVVKEGETDFDYEAKYKNDAVDEKIVMDAPDEDIQNIQKQVKQVFDSLGFNVYARIDGFLTEDKQILIHDPNTIPGMTPASFIFRQMAEIGLNSTQTLTFVLRNSILERIRTGKKGVILQKVLQNLDAEINNLKNHSQKTVALLFGGFSQNREASYQNEVKKLYSQISASAELKALPIFVHGTAENPKFDILPVNLMYQDSIEEVHQKLQAEKHPFVKRTIVQTQEITKRYAGNFPQVSESVSFEQVLENSDTIWFSESALENIIRENYANFEVTNFDDSIFSNEL